MKELIIGVISSLVATVLTVTAGWFGWSWPRRLLLRLLARMSGTGIERSYPQQKIANADLEGDLRKARWVRVLAGRGNELTRDSFQALWQPGHARLESVQILLPDPADPGGWLGVRENEMRQADHGFEAGLLAKQVSANVDYVSAIAAGNAAVSLRLFDAPNDCRIIATDQVVYFTPYMAAVHGRNSPCLVFRNGGVMYEHALQIFTRLWQRAAPS